MIARVPGDSVSGVRKPPPRPLGDCPSFPYTVATASPTPQNEAGLSLKIQLVDFSSNSLSRSNSTRDVATDSVASTGNISQRVWRSGERLSGVITLERERKVKVPLGASRSAVSDALHPGGTQPQKAKTRSKSHSPGQTSGSLRRVPLQKHGSTSSSFYDLINDTPPASPVEDPEKASLPPEGGRRRTKSYDEEGWHNRAPPLLVKSLSLSCYSESRTLYSTLAPPPQPQQPKESQPPRPSDSALSPAGSASPPASLPQKKSGTPSKLVTALSPVDAHTAADGSRDLIPTLAHEMHRSYAGRSVLLRPMEGDEWIGLEFDHQDEWEGDKGGTRRRSSYRSSKSPAAPFWADQLPSEQGAQDPKPPSSIEANQKEITIRESSSFPFIIPLPYLLHSSLQSLPPRHMLPQSIQELAKLPRTPPPTCRDSRDASVEWVLEAVLRTVDPKDAYGIGLGNGQNEEGSEDLFAGPDARKHDIKTRAPQFNGESKEKEKETDERGILKLGPHVLPVRIVFKFLPSSQHAQPLYTPLDPPTNPIDSDIFALQKRTTAMAPAPKGFARDLREESSIAGTKILHSSETSLSSSGHDVQMQTHWKEVAVKSSGALGKSIGTLRVEVTILAPFLLLRDLSTLEVPIRLVFHPPGKKGVEKPKNITLTKAVAVLSCRTVTRGGRDDRGWLELEELRRVEIPFDSSSASTNGKSATDNTSSSSSSSYSTPSPPIPSKSLKNVPPSGLDISSSGPAVATRISIPLQTSDTNPATGKVMRRVRQLGISFRTPNIEREHLLSVTLFSTAHPNGFYILRVPIQILAGESNELVDYDQEMTAACGALGIRDSNSLNAAAVARMQGSGQTSAATAALLLGQGQGWG